MPKPIYLRLQASFGDVVVADGRGEFGELFRLTKVNMNQGSLILKNDGIGRVALRFLSNITGLDVPVRLRPDRHPALRALGRRVRRLRRPLLVDNRARAQVKSMIFECTYMVVVL